MRTMSDKRTTGGVLSQPTVGHDQSVVGSAAAALTLPSLGQVADSAVDTQNDVAIARALSTGYECFHDDQSIPSDDSADSDLDFTPYPSKKMDAADSKHSAPASAKPTAVASGAKAKDEVPAAPGTAAHSLYCDSHLSCIWCLAGCSRVRSTVRLVCATAVLMLQPRRSSPLTTNSRSSSGPALCTWTRLRKRPIASGKRSTSKRGRSTESVRIAHQTSPLLQGRFRHTAFSTTAIVRH